MPLRTPKFLLGRGVSRWGQEIYLEPVTPGGIDAAVLLFDDLKKDDFTLETKFHVEVFNHLPYIVITPSCSIDDSGEYNFTVSGHDEDWDDKERLYIKSSVARHGTVSGTLAGGFTYKYDQKPIAESVKKEAQAGHTTPFELKAKASADSDTISLQLCAPYDCSPLEDSVDFSGPDI